MWYYAKREARSLVCMFIVCGNHKTLHKKVDSATSLKKKCFSKVAVHNFILS